MSNAATATPSLAPDAGKPAARRPVIALVGSPNTGKTTLFNVLTGLRARTANYSGTTVEQKIGLATIGARLVEVLDLPGVYSLRAATLEEQVAAEVLAGKSKYIDKPSLAVVIADANNIERSLFVISQLMEHDMPVVVALNLVDLAERHGIHVDPVKLSKELGCPVVPTVASEGKGIEELKQEIARALQNNRFDWVPLVHPSACGGCSSCPFQTRYNWSDEVTSRCVRAPRVAKERKTEKIDEVLTHPVFGVLAFLSVMMTVFYLIFSVASVPMDMIDALFSTLGGWVAAHVPEGDFQSFLVDGVIGGVGGILIFLPQICILFLFLALLDDSGYLARAAFVMDRLMRRIGLPGTAFVPLLSAHACAIPAIMSTRVIRDPRDRLVTILVAPLMTCSARIPVYAMVVALLFPDDPLRAALLFTGAYGLGISAALIMAWLFKKTILPGESKPLVLELPGYRIPGLRAALMFTLDRAKVFVMQAGTIILFISIGLWVLATFPKPDAPPAESVALVAQADALLAAGDEEGAEAIRLSADNLAASAALESSFAGRLGKLIEPVVRPLGFDWQIGIGIISSFAAREVIVSTLSVVYGLGAETAEENSESLYDAMRQAKHADGSSVFSLPACVSLLVFYVLAMQCLPTQAATRRETNSWKWPVFQLVYMTVLAYTASLVAFQGLTALGF